MPIDNFLKLKGTIIVYSVFAFCLHQGDTFVSVCALKHGFRCDSDHCVETLVDMLHGLTVNLRLIMLCALALMICESIIFAVASM